jgi:hypothetical protein
VVESVKAASDVYSPVAARSREQRELASSAGADQSRIRTARLADALEPAAGAPPALLSAAEYARSGRRSR